MNQRQRSIRAGIRQAKRTGQPFHMVEVAPCTEPKVADEAKVKEAIAEETRWRCCQDKRKIKHLKSKIA